MIYTYTVLSQDLFHTWTYDMNLSISMKNTQAGLESHKSFLKQAALTLTFVMALWLQRSIKVALWLQHCDNKGHPNWNKSHKPGCSLGREKCVREEPESRTSAYSHPLRLPFLTSPWDTACNTHTQQNQMPWPFKLLPKLFSFLPFNPFPAQACKLSRLKDARMRLQTVDLPVHNIHFQCFRFSYYPFTCQRKKRQREGRRVWNLALLLAVFKWHRSSEGVKHIIL